MAVGEDSYGVGASADFAVEALIGVVGPDLGPYPGGEGREREGVAWLLACGESSRPVCVTKCAILLEYQGILAVMARIPVVDCVGPSPTRLSAW